MLAVSYEWRDNYQQSILIRILAFSFQILWKINYSANTLYTIIVQDIWLTPGFFSLKKTY